MGLASACRQWEYPAGRTHPQGQFLTPEVAGKPPASYVQISSGTLHIILVI